MASPRAALVLVVSVAGCGHGSDGAAPPPVPQVAAQPMRDAAPEIPARPLGMPDLASFQWRKRGGQTAFRIARKAEDKGDWPAVALATTEALKADPGHLDADYLLAIALVKTGDTRAMLAPLAAAEAGDFGKWGQASLEQPALSSWLSTADGEAWRQRVAADHARYVAALARSMIVTAAGDVYAFDPDDKRWYRLTRTAGAVTAAYGSGDTILYVTRAKQGFGVGLVALDDGRTTAPQRIAAAAPIVLVADGDKISVGAGASWRALDRKDGTLRPLPVKARPAGDSFEVWNHHAKLHHKPQWKVKADWDDQMLASAMRVGRGERIVSVPSPALIDGNTVAWAPDHEHVAFVALLDEHCAPGAPSTAAFVADAETGTARELERASGGIAIEWAGNGRVAIAGDHGVSLLSIEGGAPQAIEGADALAIPRRTSRCTPEAPDDSPPEDVEDTP